MGARSRGLSRAAVLAVALATAACQTPTHSLDCADIGDLDETVGVVFGSVLVTVADGADEGSFWGGDGAEAGDSTFRVTALLPNPGSFVEPDRYELDLRDGHETFFVARLPTPLAIPAGYWFATVEQRSWRNPAAELSVRFEVQPARVSYVGRLVIEIPARIAGPESEPLNVRIEDARVEAMNAFAARLPSMVDRVEEASVLMIDKDLTSGRFFNKTEPPRMP